MLEVSACDCWDVGGVGEWCECTCDKGLGVAHMLFGNLTLHLGLVCTITYVIVMISLL